MLAFVLLIFLAGSSVYRSLPKGGAPNVTIPYIYVSAPYRGVAARDASKLIAKPIEKALRDLKSLKKISSTSVSGHAGILLQFGLGFDPSSSAIDIREKIRAIKNQLPTDIEDPQVIEVSLDSEMILSVSVFGDIPERVLLQVSKDLKDDLSMVPGVLEVGIFGIRDEVTEIIIEPELIEAHRVTLQDLMRVKEQNVLIAAGSFHQPDGSFKVSVPATISNVEDVMSIPLRSDGEKILTLADISTVRRGFVERENTARFNGQKTVILTVFRKSGSNILDIIEAVREKVNVFDNNLPSGLSGALDLSFNFDQSILIKDTVNQLEGSILTTIIIVFTILMLALSPIAAILVSLTIPLSFFISFPVMAGMGLTINNMVMFGLMLSIGLLIDASIVVVEYAQQLIEDGQDSSEAFAEAAHRMWIPVLTSTATTLCAFLPLLFWPGVPGEFMRYFPITLIFVLTASFLSATIILPVLGAMMSEIFLKKKPSLDISHEVASCGHDSYSKSKSARKKKGKSVNRQEHFFMRLFSKFLYTTLFSARNTVLCLVCASLLLAGIVVVYARHNNGVEFFVKTDPFQVVLHVRARGNLSIEERDKLVKKVEQRIIAIDEFSGLFSKANAAGSESRDAPKDSIGSITIEFINWKERRNATSIIADVTDRVQNIPGIVVETREVKDGPRQGKPISLQIFGRTWDGVVEAAEIARGHMEKLKGLKDIEDNLPLPGIDWELQIDRAMASRYGVDFRDLGAMAELVTHGVKIDKYMPVGADEQQDIIVRFGKNDRLFTVLDTLVTNTPQGQIPVSAFAKLVPVHAAGDVNRSEGKSSVILKADVFADYNVNQKIAELQEWLDTTNFAEENDVTVSFVGDFENQQESAIFLKSAFSLALAGMFLILLAEFNSLYNTVVVLTAVMMAVVGVLLGMLIAGHSFSIIMTGLAICALAGIVVNDNIVLIDAFQTFRKNYPPLEAIHMAVISRTRAVLLTTLTTSLGLLPGALGMSVDYQAFDINFGSPEARTWVQLSSAIVSGLIFATFLLLFVTPSLLAIRVHAKNYVVSLNFKPFVQRIQNFLGMNKNKAN
jgi:multidrug efflux pump